MPAADDPARFVHHVHVHRALQRLVDAVLAPGLGDGLQLGVRRVAALLPEIRLHRLHLRERQEQMTLAAEPGELLVGQVAHRDVAHTEVVLVAAGEAVGDERLEVDALDDAVGEHALGDAL